MVIKTKKTEKFVAHLLMNGVNIREVKELPGHRDVEATMISTHVQAVQKYLDARRAKTEERVVYINTSSDKVCSTTQQMSVFQQLVR